MPAGTVFPVHIFCDPYLFNPVFTLMYCLVLLYQGLGRYADENLIVKKLRLFLLADITDRRKTGLA
ncbi:hypothetical protein PAJ34TS1_01430 [Paenibacillus azoreducens]